MDLVSMTPYAHVTSAARRSLVLPIGAFIAAAILLPWVGPGPISVSRVLHHQAPDYAILIQLRITRTLLALVAGGALSLAGSLFQAMLRDALATPYTLGISAGASLGAVAAIAAGWQMMWGIPATWVGALAGAFAVLTLVIGGFSKRGQISAFSLLLTGIAINSVCMACIIILGGFAGMSRTFSIARWLIGSVDSTSYTSLSVLSIVVLGLAALIMTQARSWNLLAVGEQWAASRGVRVPTLLRTGYIAGSILVAGAIALTGPIGFVGLIVPHLVRSRISPDHRILLPSVFFFGGALLALCDSVGRIVMRPAEIPAGAVLALIGGPYLVWTIRQRRSSEEI
ncbi:FecCD family ABC transporter permease [Granulicella arctica]|uniref:Iron complex transport system permease protein n=1 Tax=Granulicella arctica TaxID=940613 RepID=A0A7Y9TTK2_9BACT|nr:iron ABC transporter permease [Granulicella arctica]NYF80053.1 iron complex transport system permease protein [Granulicella arctica]